MTKTEQREINERVLCVLNDYRDKSWDMYHERKLRSCSATVADAVDPETGELRYIVLRSYRTVIALIDTRTNTLYDFLRYVYGYTATSAQHISKFARDYHATTCMTYKEV